MAPLLSVEGVSKEFQVRGKRIVALDSITLALEQGEFVVLSSIGEMVILSAEGKLRSLARLPSGHFHRTSMAVAPDGSVLVSAGFHIREVYRVSSAGVVTSLAHDLGDPQGVAVDRSGAIYIAETALHRIVRIVATGR